MVGCNTFASSACKAFCCVATPLWHTFDQCSISSYLEALSFQGKCAKTKGPIFQSLFICAYNDNETALMQISFANVIVFECWTPIYVYTFLNLVESIMFCNFICFWQCEPVLHGWERHATFTCCFWAPACKNVKIAQRTRQQSHIIEWFPALHMLWKPVKSQIFVHLCCVLPFVLPNRHLDDAMLPPEVFERLIDLRQQQERSIQNIEKLRDEHRDWQADSCWSAVYTQESYENLYQK